MSTLTDIYADIAFFAGLFANFKVPKNFSF